MPLDHTSEIIKTFNDKDGIARLLDDVFETLKYSGGEVYISGIDERKFLEADKKVINEHIERMAYHGISERLLAREGDSFFFAGPQSKYRWVPEHLFNPTPVYVYGDKIAMIIWNPEADHENPTVITIKNFALADAHRKQFLFIWDRAIVPPLQSSTPDERIRLEQTVLKRFGNRVTSITDHDRRTFRGMFEKDSFKTYSNSFYYLCQAANGSGAHKLGLKYYDGDMLATIGIFNRNSLGGGWHFHIIRPVGIFDAKKLVTLAKNLLEISGTPVFMKKVTREQQAQLLEIGFSPIESYPWHAQAIEEDDTYPEEIIDIGETLRAIEATGKRDLKDKYQRFMARFGAEVQVADADEGNADVMRALVKKFFEYLEMKELHISQPTDYDNIIGHPPLGKNGETYFSQIVSVNGQPAAFFAIEPNSSESAGLYANITLHQEFPYLSEYLIVHCCRLLKTKGYQYLNLGGSETAGLFQFKEKFAPVAYNKMHWIVYKI